MYDRGNPSWSAQPYIYSKIIFIKRSQFFFSFFFRVFFISLLQIQFPHSHHSNVEFKNFIKYTFELFLIFKLSLLNETGFYYSWSTEQYPYYGLSKKFISHFCINFDFFLFFFYLVLALLFICIIYLGSQTRWPTSTLACINLYCIVLYIHINVNIYRNSDKFQVLN